jgi:hypothetical protein
MKAETINAQGPALQAQGTAAPIPAIDAGRDTRKATINHQGQPPETPPHSQAGSAEARAEFEAPMSEIEPLIPCIAGLQPSELGVPHDSPVAKQYRLIEATTNISEDGTVEISKTVIFPAPNERQGGVSTEDVRRAILFGIAPPPHAKRDTPSIDVEPPKKQRKKSGPRCKIPLRDRPYLTIPQITKYCHDYHARTFGRKKVERAITEGRLPADWDYTHLDNEGRPVRVVHPKDVDNLMASLIICRDVIAPNVKRLKPATIKRNPRALARAVGSAR